MTPAQQAALEALAERALTPAEIDWGNQRNDAALTASLSAGLTQFYPRLVSERGVLEALGPVEGDAFLAALESIIVPADLPVEAQPFLGAIRRGAAWLKGDGIDVGSKTARDMLDLLAAIGKVSPASVATLKGLGQTARTLDVNAVSAILNEA